MERSADDCFAILHADGWSVGDFAVDEDDVRIWHVFGHRGDQKILGRGLTEGDAWRAAAMAADSATRS